MVIFGVLQFALYCGALLSFLPSPLSISFLFALVVVVAYVCSCYMQVCMCLCGCIIYDYMKARTWSSCFSSGLHQILPSDPLVSFALALQ